MRPCWLVLHRWRSAKVSGHASACDFELERCLTCGAYRMGVWFEMGRWGRWYGIRDEEAHRFFMAVGHREREALFELWYERSVQSVRTGPEAQSSFEARRSPLCCAAPDWETSLVELERLGAAAVDLERCRGCGAWRLTTYWPKDSSDRAAGETARISAEKALALKAADPGERRKLLDSEGWYGLNG